MTTPTPPTDEQAGHVEARDFPGFCHECSTRWPCDYEDMRAEVHRLRIQLTGQEHTLIALRAERDKAVRVAVGLEHDYAAANAEREEMRERGERWRALGERLAVALGGHRSDMHQASGRPCATCRFSRTVLDEWVAAIHPEASGQKE